MAILILSQNGKAIPKSTLVTPTGDVVGKTIQITRSITLSASVDVTIPAGTALECKQGGIITIPDGRTLTINGSFQAGLYQCFNCVGTGKVVFGAKTLQIRPSWFGAIADGTTDNLGAFQKTAESVTGNQIISFSFRGDYLIKWEGAKPEKSTIGIDLFQKHNVTLEGNGATIRIIDHNVETCGGLLFAKLIACHNPEIHGFKSVMSFVGSNKDAAYYPESGFLYAHNTEENATVTPVPIEDQLTDISVHDCDFDIRSEYGAYTTSQNAYEGDANNGGKYYSIFVRGEETDLMYSTQNKNCEIYRCRWNENHQGYGIWVWGFSNTHIHHNKFSSWANRTANYQNTTLGGSVPAIRCHKFGTRNWRIEHNIIQGRPPSLRTGSLLGASALIDFQQENTAYDSESTVVIAHNSLCPGSHATVLTLTDVGIAIRCSGNFDIFGNTFSSNYSDTVASNCAAGLNAAILLNEEASSSGRTQYINVKDNTFNVSCQKLIPIVYRSSGTGAASTRSIKSLVASGNIVHGFFKNFITRIATAGEASIGIASQVITKNIINGVANSLIVPANALCIPVALVMGDASDYGGVTDNSLLNCYNGINVVGGSAANSYLKDNVITSIGAQVLSGNTNYLSYGFTSVASFAPGVAASISGSANIMNNAIALTISPTNTLVNAASLAGVGGTALGTDPTNTINVMQWPIGTV